MTFPVPVSGRRQLTEIVLTGGPCSGKSTSMARLSETLEEEGFRVLVVPEIVTMLISGGLSDLARLAAEDRDRFTAVEERIALMQRDWRLHYRALAQTLAGPTVILYDRAEMDVAAYVGRDEFEAIMARHDLGYDETRDSYDLVVHMVSTAVDLPHLYSNSNNPARYESAEEAVRADRAVLDAWTGAKLTVVDNATDFETKVQRVRDAVLHAVGVAEPFEIERKFLLTAAPDLSLPQLANAPVFTIKQTYLHTEEPGVERRVRVREHAGQETFIYTIKSPVGDDPTVRQELEARISRAEYRRLLSDADPGRAPVRKQRRVFLHGKLIFELDSFPDLDLHVLEVELADVNQEVTLPDYLVIAKEVTADPQFRNHALAARLVNATS